MYLRAMGTPQSLVASETFKLAAAKRLDENSMSTLTPYGCIVHAWLWIVKGKLEMTDKWRGNIIRGTGISNRDKERFVAHKLHGVITSMLTAFNKNLGLDEETLAAELEYQIKAGVNGVCILGGTGESMSLTSEERLRVVEVTMKVVGDRIPVVVGCFVPEVEEAAAFGEKIQ